MYTVSVDFLDPFQNQLVSHLLNAKKRLVSEYQCAKHAKWPRALRCQRHTPLGAVNEGAAPYHRIQSSTMAL